MRNKIFNKIHLNRNNSTENELKHKPKLII